MFTSFSTSPVVLPDHNLLGSWEIDFGELDVTRDEALDRLNVGYMWHAMALFAYMAFVVGCSLIVAVYRMGEGGDPDVAPASSGHRPPVLAGGVPLAPGVSVCGSSQGLSGYGRKGEGGPDRGLPVGFDFGSGKEKPLPVD